MAKKSDNTENFKKYQDHLKNQMRNGLTSPDHKETIAELVSEGNHLIGETTNPPLSKKKLNGILGATSPNAYVRARTKVLLDLPLWRRHELERMEKNGDLDNRFYTEFVQRVMEYGNYLSDKKD